MTPHTRAHLARLSAERVGLIPRPWYPPVAPAVKSGGWGTVILTALMFLPVLSALVKYIAKEGN